MKKVIFTVMLVSVLVVGFIGCDSATPLDTTADVKTINHKVIDPSNPVFLSAGGYFLNMSFEVSRDLDLTEPTVQFNSFYEYSIDDGESIEPVKDSSDSIFMRDKEWGYIRTGSDYSNPEPQPDILNTDTEYYFAVTGDTIDRVNSIYSFTEGTEYKVRVVYEITDESGHMERTTSHWVNYTR